MLPNLSLARHLLDEELGAAAAEYAILVAAVAGAIFAMTFPYDLRNIFTLLLASIQALISAATGS